MDTARAGMMSASAFRVVLTWGLGVAIILSLFLRLTGAGLFSRLLRWCSFEQDGFVLYVGWRTFPPKGKSCCRVSLGC